ncbi:uncharacterized protein LOC120351205 [Nilaparvata lugens]|uniref:uncharacterized protein LOC120351205 n=1 Tax=Nilaparvata lugens TaxID=108931 RepID=UPI00193D58C3|nr:uncharacterized protein LOC120351205 [Nilaparvata lugens]
MARFIDPKDFDRVLNELESEEECGEQNDFEDDIDFEAEVIEHDRHNSEPENDLEELMVPVMREKEENLEGLRIFIGRNGDTLWANRPLHQTTKTKAVNIIKTIPGPKGEARKC